MEYEETRKDAPDTRDDLRQPRDAEKTETQEQDSDQGEYKFTDWASI